MAENRGIFFYILKSYFIFYFGVIIKIKAWNRIYISEIIFTFDRSWNEIKSFYEGVSNNIALNAQKSIDSNNAVLKNAKDNLKNQIKERTKDNNARLIEWQNRIDDLRWLEAEAIWITNNKIKEEIKSENEAIKKYLEWLKNKDEWTKWSAKTESDILEKSEKLNKEQQDKFNDRQNERLDLLKEWYKTYADILDDEVEKSEKTINEYDKQITKLKDGVDELTSKLWELEGWRAETLWERNIEILEREAEIQEKLNELKKEDYTNDRLKEEKELNEEINELLKEKTLISQNATTLELDEAKRVNDLSPTAKFLEEFELKKKALEEERLLKEQQITDLQIQKDSEEAILLNFTEKKEALDKRYADKVFELEESITDKTIVEVNKRIAILEKLRQKALAATAAMRNAWVNVSIPEWTNTSWNNTSNTTSVKINVNGANEPKVVASEVSKIITNANKNADKWIY